MGEGQGSQTFAAGGGHWLLLFCACAGALQNRGFYRDFNWLCSPLLTSDFVTLCKQAVRVGSAAGGGRQEKWKQTTYKT